jgi:DNA-binding HxlR family transcriptional regulator
MRRTALDDNPCSIAKALDVLGDPWTMLILRDAIIGATRFEQFTSRLGIPRATLTARLGHLCDAGVLRRVPYQDAPVRHEYVLTEKGEALRPVIVTLLQWGDRWLRDDPPPTRLIDADTGRAIEPVLIDASTGTPLEDLQVRVVGPVVAGLPGGVAERA